MIGKNFFILYFSIIFFLRVYFCFAAMAFHRCVTNNAGQLHLIIEMSCRKVFSTLWGKQKYVNTPILPSIVSLNKIVNK